MTCNNGVEFIILFSIFSIHLVVNYINSLIICGLRVLNLAIVMNTLSFHVTISSMTYCHILGSYLPSTELNDLF